MRLSRLYLQSIRFHWRVHVFTVLAAATAATVLTGSLVVGDSMRGSLRQTALARLGPVQNALVSGRYFRESLANDLAAAAQSTPSAQPLCPMLMVQGSISQADTGARSGRVSILGTDERFWTLSGTPARSIPERSAVIGEPLARAIGAKAGDDILIRMQRPSPVPGETLLGLRQDGMASLRLTVERVIAEDWASRFTLTPGRLPPLNVYVPMATLQRALKQEGRANAILSTGPRSADAWQQALAAAVRPPDLGLRVSADARLGCLVLESDALFLDSRVETAALDAAKSIGARAAAVLTYLANKIALEAHQPGGSSAEVRSIPYSTVTALDLQPDWPWASLPLDNNQPAPPLRADEILLNTWAAAQLGTAPGDRIRLTYYAVEDFGRLRTDTAVFTLRGVVGMHGLGSDRRLVPEFDGITNAVRISDWQPPFPIDFGRIGPADEKYWDAFGPTPKAFVSLAAGRALWTKGDGRFGRATSIRVGAVPPGELEGLASRFEQELLKRLDPASMGLAFQPVRANALAASQGSTDFGMLFIGFSFFLIVAAGILTTLLFRLGVEGRSSEAGILLAVGIPRRTVRRLFLAEGATLAMIGVAIGTVGSLAYAALMLAGLNSWWATGTAAPPLSLHATGTSMAGGAAAGLALGLLSIAWAIRGLRCVSVRSLMSQAASADPPGAAAGRRRSYVLVVVLSSLAATALITLSLTTGSVPETAAFFGGGTCMLVACIGIGALMLFVREPGSPVGFGPMAITRMGVRNACRRPRRSLLTFSLIAFASFIIVATGANRQSSVGAAADKHSGTGGYSLLAESTIPILQDLNSETGRLKLRLPTTLPAAAAGATIVPLRLRTGDEASCLNPYRPRSPRILGATEAMIRRGGFVFQSSLQAGSSGLILRSGSPGPRDDNPWSLLHATFADGAIPAIGDYSTVKWILHLGLGNDLAVDDERGRKVRLRIVGMLAGSILQNELVIADDRFVGLFPSTEGYGFFLIDSPGDAADAALQQTLERGLADYGFDVASTTERLSSYMAVENTYLSAFQALGGLGVVLGTLGLATVLLRNVTERRGELALLVVLGYRRTALGWMIVAENGAILAAGLLAGTLPALLATIPHLRSGFSAIPWASLSFTLLAVLASGILAGAVAVLPALRGSLLSSLRHE